MLVKLPLLLFFLLHCIPGSPSSEEPKWATVSTVFNQPSSHHCSVLFQVSLHLHRHRHCQPCTTSSVVATVHLCALQTIASLASLHCDSCCAPLLVQDHQTPRKTSIWLWSLHSLVIPGLQQVPWRLVFVLDQPQSKPSGPGESHQLSTSVSKGSRALPWSGVKGSNSHWTPTQFSI